MVTIIKNATVVNDGQSRKADVLVEDDIIVKIEENINQPCASQSVEVMDAEGCYLLPGVVDDHVHFRQPGLTQKADIATESRAAAAGGVTTYFDMPNTVPQTPPTMCMKLATLSRTKMMS